MQEEKSKNIPMLLIGAGIIIILTLGLFFFYSSRKNEQTLPNSQNFSKDQIKISNPEVNPLGKTNPFSDIKTNPFE